MPETPCQQILDYSNSNKSICPSDEDGIIQPDYKTVAFHPNKFSLLLGDVWLFNQVDTQDRKELTYVITNFN